MKKYDIFISYRRVGGYETAKHLFDLLSRDGFSVSFDIDTLRNGDFDTAIYSIIDSCKDFIIILSPGIFERSVKNNDEAKDDDWVRIELSYALKKKKNIVPIMLKDFEGFPPDLPADIAGVSRKNAVIYEMHYFDAFYEKLKKDFLKSRSRGRRIIPLIVAAVAVVAGLAWYAVDKGVLSLGNIGGIDGSKTEAVVDSTAAAPAPEVTQSVRQQESTAVPEKKPENKSVKKVETVAEWLFADEPGYICIVPSGNDYDKKTSEMLSVIYAAYQWVIGEGKPVSKRDSSTVENYNGYIATQDKMYFDYKVRRSGKTAGSETAYRISVTGTSGRSSSVSSFVEIFRYMIFEQAESGSLSSSANAQVGNYIVGQIKGEPFVLETMSMADSRGDKVLKLWLNDDEIRMPSSYGGSIEGGKFIALEDGMALDTENILMNGDLAEYGSLSRYWASVLFDQFVFLSYPSAKTNVEGITGSDPDKNIMVTFTDNSFLEPYSLVLNGIKDGKVSLFMRLDKEKEQERIRSLESGDGHQ